MGIPKKLCEYSKKKECFCIKHFMLCDSFWIYHSICSSCQISQCYCWIFIIGFPLKHIVPTHALITRAHTQAKPINAPPIQHHGTTTNCCDTYHGNNWFFVTHITWYIEYTRLLLRVGWQACAAWNALENFARIEEPV